MKIDARSKSAVRSQEGWLGHWPTQLASLVPPRLYKRVTFKARRLAMRMAGFYLRRRPAPRGLAITYANDELTDGAGAQLQRIYGIYAVARFFNVPYVHTPLKAIDYQGVLALEANRADASYVERINERFVIPSDIELPEEREVHRVSKPGLRAFLGLLGRASGNGRFLLVEMTFPYRLTDTMPTAYAALERVNPFRKKSNEVFRAAIHVRRGELFVIDSSRMLPNAYYIQVAKRMAETMEALGVSYRFELYTELPTGKMAVTSGHHGMAQRDLEHFSIDPRQSKLEEFAVIPGLEMFINTEVIETWEAMATADALVLSHSTFSYFAALFNPDGLIFYHSFEHSPLPSWLIASDTGAFSQEQFRAGLERWQARRDAEPETAAERHAWRAAGAPTNRDTPCAAPGSSRSWPGAGTGYK